MRVAIVGTRDYANLAEVASYVMNLPPDVTVVSGGARGVDQAAIEAATMRGLATQVILPDWNKYGKSAGIIRNGLLFDQCAAVVAFWDGTSRGTYNMIQRCREAKKPLTIFLQDGGKVELHHAEGAL